VLAWVLFIGVMALIAAGAFYGGRRPSRRERMRALNSVSGSMADQAISQGYWAGVAGGDSCAPTDSGGSDSGGNC
jgi:hypothetical protein